MTESPEQVDPELVDPAGVDPQQRVHQALAPLDRLDRRPLAEHVVLFEDLHAALNDALATDTVTAPSGPQ